MKRQSVVPVLLLLGIVAAGLLFAAGSNRIAGSPGNAANGSTAQAPAQSQSNEGKAMEKKSDGEVKKIEKSDAEWRKELTADQYHILREKGTERAFTGDLYQHKENGLYICAACGNELFTSQAKYESGCGWPSYFEPMADKNIDTHSDKTLGMVRTEVTCARCGGHLGHVFDDGPQPTGLRYCINSGALDFVPEDSVKKSYKTEKIDKSDKK